MYPEFKVTNNPSSVFSGKTEDEICMMIRDDSSLFMKVPIKSENICVAAILEDPSNIAFIKDPCEKLQLSAVLQIPEYIQFIRKPTDMVCRKVVYKSYSCLRFIEKKVGIKHYDKHEPCYDLIMIAYQEAVKVEDEHFVIAIIGDTIKDHKFLKEFKRIFNDPIIREHMTDHLLEIYDKM